MTPWLQRVRDLASDGRWRRSQAKHASARAIAATTSTIDDAEAAGLDRLAHWLAPDETWIEPEDIR